MLRMLAGAGIPVPAVEAEHDGVLLLEYIEHDGLFSPAAWRSIGETLRRLHGLRGETYGWNVDYRLGTVELDNRASTDWPTFWGEQRLLSVVQVLDRPWRERIEGLARRLPDLLPPDPPPALLHGDLWSGNILVSKSRLAALVDPACYHGHCEADLAMLALFAEPPEEFWESYGKPDPGAAERLPVYQLFPALVHLRLFGQGYAALVDRLLGRI
jgi:fructosamine-3-kinase